MSTNRQLGLKPFNRPTGPKVTNVERRRELARTHRIVMTGGKGTPDGMARQVSISPVSFQPGPNGFPVHYEMGPVYLGGRLAPPFPRSLWDKPKAWGKL